ncbi:exosome component Rrp46 [Pyrrhoderma noxium]|uniref:Exosome component Rrp46 n=1 Tax=Pyrrhoderma noxium TaxID=2282107 RepID=A0A286UNJ8_9AGAM|nr:exosome component Rrp46 [Pyrrhoderma noxium]
MSYQRPDGRLLTETRNMTTCFDGLDGVDGSARFGFGETKALASVSGPIEVRPAAEQPSKATFEVIVRPLAGLAGTESKTMASTIRNAQLPSLILTNNPRTLVQVVVQSLSTVHTAHVNRTAGPLRSGPSLIAATINAASLALLNASSIPLCGVVCAIAIGRVRSTGELFVDPSEEELRFLDGSGTFAFLVSGKKVEDRGSKGDAELVFSNWSAAPFGEEELGRVIELARAGALRVRDHFKEVIALDVLGGVQEDEDMGAGSEAKQELVDDEKMEIS